MRNQPHIYIMTNRKKGVLYVGVTANLTLRVHQHRSPNNKTFTGKYGLNRLVYFEPQKSMYAAIKREKAIKKWHRSWKFKLIESLNPEWVDLAGYCHEGFTSTGFSQS